MAAKKNKTPGMEFSLDRKTWQRALGAVDGIACRKSTIPVLEHTLIQANGEKGTVTFGASSIETALEITVAGNVKQSGVATVSPTKVKELVGALPDGDIWITAEEGRVVLGTGFSEYRCASLPPEDWPVVNRQEGEVVEFTLLSDLFARVVTETTYVCDEKDSRVWVNGVYLRLEPGLTIWQSLDGHRGTRRRLPVEGITTEGAYLIPASALDEAKGLINQGKITLRLTENEVSFTGEGVRLTARLLDARFPNMDRVIPKQSPHTIKVGRELLAQAFRRLQIFARDSGAKNRVLVTLGPETATFSAEDENDRAQEQLTLLKGCDLITFGLNALYLQEALSSFTGEIITLGITDAESPITLRQDDYQDYLSLVQVMSLK